MPSSAFFLARLLSEDSERYGSTGLPKAPLDP